MHPNTTTKTIPLTRGLIATVDKSDYGRVAQFKWYANEFSSRFYAVHNDSDGIHSILLHRFIMGANKGEIIDHINGNGLDCTRGNLRFCNAAENARNHRINKNNTSGYKGVYKSVRDNRKKIWIAKITVNRKEIFLGRFLSQEEAAHAYDIAAYKYHGEFASTNFK